ncbi:MAG TPA: helix-turn-helix transcriptional regulator [Clostridiaceae bacterium]|nr:helix-turn-helix transcriptional regulator [Clostridiaceae bacterium]
MNQAAVGKYIAQKRKEKNLTQEQLAEKIGVSNKSISKWECGKCMPDYSIIESLCRELGITVSELIAGEDKGQNNSIYDEKQMVDMLERIQKLEKQKQTMLGLILIIMGMALSAMSQNYGGNSFRDFISGVMSGLSVGEMLAGIYVVGRSLAG